MKKILSWYLVMGIAFIPVSGVQALGLPPTDTTAPVISNITVSSVTPVGAVIAWTTDEVSDSQIEYGTTTGYGSNTTLNVALGTAHLQTLSDLQPGTVYHYRVQSRDAAGNAVVSADQTFTTEASVTPSSSSSSSSSLSVEVSSSSSVQTDIITNPVTTATSSSSSAGLIPEPDAYGPVISNVAISQTTTVGTVIAWTTDEVSDSQIEYGLTDVYGFETSLDVTLGTAHIQTFTNLQPGTTYHFRVKSKDTAGNVTISEDHVFTTESAPIVADEPPVILTQTVASVSQSSATVLWTTDEIADSQVEYGLTSSYGSHTTLDASLGLEHAVIISSLQPGTTYHYRIKTIDGDSGFTTYSGDDTFTTAAATVTIEPSSSSSSSVGISLSVSEVEAAALTASSALLAWTTSVPADSQIEYGLTTNYGSHTTLDASLASLHAVLLTNLSPETTYHYRVKSHDALGNLVSSEDKTFTTLAAPVAHPSLSTPPSITTVTVGTESTSATITWTTDKLANSQVEYGLTASYGTSSALNGTFGAAHTVILTNLEPDTTYHYRIRTTDAGGRETLSADETFTTASSIGGSSVTLPSLGDTETSALTASSATITWMTSVPTDAQIEYGTTTAYGSHSPTDTSLSLEHSTTLTGLSPDTTYHYRIRSTDASGNHVLSADQTFTTLEQPTDQSAPIISNVTITHVGTDSATISWTTDDASTARVQYGLTTSYGAYTTLDSSPATHHSATITGLFPDTTYNFTVQSQDSAGNLAISVNHTLQTQTAPYSSGTMSVPVVAHVTNTSVTLSWNVPFDDSAGTEFYDIRYSTEPITQDNFDDATPAHEGVEHIVHVNENGRSTEHIYAIIDLEAGTSYYFGIRSDASRSTLSHLEETNHELTYSDEQSGNGGNLRGSQQTQGSHTITRTNAGNSTPTGVGGNGGSRRLPVVSGIHAQGADGEVALLWESPLDSPFIHSHIVRKETDFPTSPDDGVTVYDGRDENFTDIGLTNGKKYHYAIYTHNDNDTLHGYSRPVLVAMLPTDEDEVIFQGITSSAPALPELNFGMTGNDVSELQKLLAKDPSVYPESIVSGYFGSLTQKAVQRFQKAQGLSQTGIADAQTRSLLSGQTLPAPVTSSSTSSSLQRDLLRGSNGDDVRRLQTFLKAQGLYPIDVTGYFGDYTFAGVKSFQQKYGLPVTGAVSTLTRQKILGISGQ